MKRQIIIFSIIINIIFSCNIDKVDLKEVTVATGDCMETCPRTVSKFDKDLNIYYYSEIPIKGKNQYFKGKITKKEWYKINQLLKKINFQKLDSIIQGADGRDLEIIAYMPERKRVIGFGGSLPDSSINALEKMSEIYKSVKLRPMSKYRFETIVQNPPPQPPKYEDVIDEIKNLKSKLNY